MKVKKIRNFTIIAHVDHGKTTLADRFLELSGAVEAHEKKNQMLDDLESEIERGITIKSRAASIKWKYKNDDGIEDIYMLNLIDNPGHKDFNYEVTRSLKGCEISLLLIDATKGIEAQTLSNYYKALDENHLIIPVLNKIDVQNIDLDERVNEIIELAETTKVEGKLGLDINLLCKISAKTGQGVKELLDTIVKFGPCPKGNLTQTRALILDSWYDKFFGVITLVRIIDGLIKKNQVLKNCSSHKSFIVVKTGIFNPKPFETPELSMGDIGFIVTQVKNPNEMKVGDTLTQEKETVVPLEGFKECKPMVYCTFYPIDQANIAKAHDILKKYALNDSAFTFSLETNNIGGMCFRCGFLGLLHMEIVQERLEKEFDLQLETTLPNVLYLVHKTNKKIEEIYNANKWPEVTSIDFIEEPEVSCTIFTLPQYIGDVTKICIEHRAIDLKLDTSNNNKILITCKIPLSEAIVNFDDKLQSSTKGYISLDYEQTGYRISSVVKLTILINGQEDDRLSMIIEHTKVRGLAIKLVETIKEILPRQNFEQKIQAMLGGKVVASEKISAFRKDVIAKCYGGHRERKDKLLDKQREGKEKMKEIALTSRRTYLPNSAIFKLTKLT